MITLPQVNLYAHGTQWTVSHGHFAFWGAYACGIIAVIYLALQRTRNLTYLERVALEVVVCGTQRGAPRDDRCAAGVGLCPGVRRARDRWIDARSVHCRPENAWFIEGMVFRFLLGIVFTAGYVVLVWDLLALGRRVPAVAAASAAE